MAREKRNLDLFDAYQEQNFTDSLAPFLKTDRRDFFKLIGAGIIVVVAAKPSAGQGWGRTLPEDFNAFLRIDESGKVTGYTGKIEMGQGISTSLAQMLAEELNVSLDQVEMVMGDTELCPWDMGTFGSMTTRFFGPPFREAAAEARAVLVALAAKELGIPKSDLTVREGRVVQKEGSRSISYGELAQGKRIVHEKEVESNPESPEEFTLVSTPVQRKDAREKVTGEAKFASDIQPEGLLYGAVLRPPAHGARLVNADLSSAEEKPGVRVVREGDFIAALHARPDLAEEARDAIAAEWERPKEGVSDRNIFDHLLEKAPAGEPVAEGGDLERGRKEAEIRLQEDYLNHYVSHAPIEPHAAVVQIQKGEATVWASTQNPFRLREEIAEELGMASEQVRVIPPFVGGGFGGKTHNLQAREAARLARATGRPVQVAWSREEEFFLDAFRPAAVVKIDAGVKKSGELVYWDYGVYAAGQRGSQHFYRIPHHLTTVYGSGWRASTGVHPLATGAWRAPAANTNTFGRECHIEYLASEAGLDPVEFRLMNLTDQRMIDVLEAVADAYGWPGNRPAGVGVGVSLGIDADTYVAHIAEVEVDEGTGKIRVRRVVCAQDMGLCINPAGAELQMEGCITMGLGYALAEEIRFDTGEIKDKNFDTYRIPRFSWLPEIETHILDRKDEPPHGGGEPAIISMGSVIANAVFDATGARVLTLPMTPARVKEALKAV